ncbi:MAG: site-2 protease family protein [Planctomycetota bacterium]|nr:site-2 protease family protein [Planctomycetota bacterium]
MEPTYYRVNASKATYAECWRATRNLFEFVLICILKTLRLSFSATYAITNEGFKRLEWDEVLADVRASLLPIRSELESVGFRYCFCYCYPTLGTMRSTTMILLSNDNKSWVSVLCERHQSGAFVNRIVVTSVRSDLSNGNLLLTCDLQNPYPLEFLCERRAGYSAARLAGRHQERIAETSPAYPVPVPDDFAMERRVLELEQRVFQHGLDRGMLIPLTAAELERLKAEGPSINTTPPAPPVSTPQATLLTNDAVMVELTDEVVYDASLADASSEMRASHYPGVIAELEKIRNKKGSWLAGAVILVVSILVFLGAGAVQWDWHIAVLLIPVLLFHELGHFLAMRLFKYRNLKMFFIPLLGAAVTGQNYNVAGWKKAIVSLAGPVPGILVGSVLGIVALIRGDQAWLLEAAEITVFLNAFNLLPFLPLDGGWIVHVLLFSRHHVLDTTFRALAAVVLILSGLLGLKLLMFIGIMMLVGLRSAYRVARVASEIRDANIDTSSPDGQTIPIETADAIISRLNAASPLPVPDVLRAQQTLQVFESVNARPPGVLGTLTLAGVHAGSFGVALVFGLILALAQHPDFARLFGPGMAGPQYRYECGTAKQWPPSADRLPAGTAATVVATFSSVDVADLAFAETKATLPAGAVVTQFGQSVLVTLDAESRQIDAFTARFELAWAAVELATAEEPLLLAIDATSLTADQAESLEREVNEYFLLPTEMAAIPPWDAERKLTEQQQVARRTFQELVTFSPYEDERCTEISLRLAETLGQEDQAKLQAILQEQRELVREIQQEHNERLLGRDDLDKDVIQLYSRQPQMPEWTQFAAGANDVENEMEDDGIDIAGDGNAEGVAAQAEWLAELRAWHLEMGSRMGQLPLAGDHPIPSVYGSIGGGNVERTGLMLRFWINFNQPDDGALAIANWLCGDGCSDVKYAFGGDE